MRWGPAWLRDEGASAAAEFALTLPIVLFLLFGTINLCLVTYAEVCLHYSVERTARWAATDAAGEGADPSSTSVTSKAQSFYYGPSLTSEQFVFKIVQTNDSSCPAINTNSAVNNTEASYEGYKVTGSGSYKIFYGLGSFPVSLSAAACFN